MDIKKSLSEIKELSSRFGLSILYLDFTDVTLIARIGNSFDVFIQIYLNTKKNKLNMALVVKGERIYGIDGEKDDYHKHPVENPDIHLPVEKTSVEEFLFDSLEILKNSGLL